MTAAQITVNAEEDGLRLDLLLTRRFTSLGRARARALVASGTVRVNGRIRAKGGAVREGDRVTLYAPPPPARFAPAPEREPELRIRFQDRYLLIVEKLAGVPCHPLRPDERGTLGNALAARFPETVHASFDPREAGLVHRLDTDTSGLVLVARDPGTFRALRAALGSGTVEKRYRALCAGRVAAPQVVRAYLVSDRKSRRRVRVSAKPARRSRPARTEILDSRPVAEFSLVELRVHSAMRHQIRAHLAWLGHPIAGDALYGGPPLPGLDRHVLHACSIRLRHPKTGRLLRVSSPLPAELRRLVRALGVQGETTRLSTQSMTRAE